MEIKDFENKSKIAPLNPKKDMQVEFNFEKRLSFLNNFDQDYLQNVEIQPFQKSMNEILPTYNKN